MRKSAASRPGSDDGQRRIIAAARDAFATYGFEGASLRAISAAAGVLHTAMLYHYSSKDVLWRAVMSELFGDLETRLLGRATAMQGQDQAVVARQLLHDFVYFCAERPELHRIMTIEGRSDTPRLAWLVENHTRRLYETVASMHASLDGPTRFEDPARLYYAIIGLAASTFTLAPEHRRLSGRDAFDPDEIAATATLVERLIFGTPVPEAK